MAHFLPFIIEPQTRKKYELLINFMILSNLFQHKKLAKRKLEAYEPLVC